MPVYIEMPKLADTMTEGTLVRWKKKKGEKIEAGDVIAEVETDKATMEMESFDDGILTEMFVAEGQKVAIGTRIALLLAPGEKAPSAGDAAPGTALAAGETAKGQGGVKAEPARAAVAANPAAVSSRVKASPLAKKVAAEKGVSLAQITGTGPGGRIVQRDVLEARNGGAPSAAPGTSPALSAVAPAPAGEGDQRIALSGMRRTIADRLLASKTQIPHFYLTIEVDAAELMRLRAEVNAASEKAGQPKLTVNDFVLKAAIAAAVRHPKVNAAWAGDAIIQYASVNLSVAVAVEDGLVTPVIRHAQTKTLREINAAVKDLAARARGKKLKPDEYAGGTFTVSNLGSYGVESFSAIINPPQAMILSIGAVVKKPVVNARNEIVAGQRMSIGLSCDHRVIDGALGAEYLAELRRLLENPALMLL